MRPAVVVCLLLFVGVCSGGYRWRYKSHEESGEDSYQDSDEDSRHDSDSDSDEDDSKCDCSRRGGFRGDILRNRADHNDVEINRLFNAAWKLEKKLDKMGHGPDVRALKARVDALTGDDCPGGMFECENRGGCVHPLQVCDYDYDCADHSDENDHTCKILPSEGSSWGAAVSHNTCFKEAADHIRIVIAKAERDEMMGSQVEVDVTTFLYTNDDKINVGHAHGYYHFGDRNLDFLATDGDIVELRCHFDGFDENSCHGKFYRHGEDEPCGYAVFVRE